LLIGSLGTGKSHIAPPLGVQAAEHHRKKVRFFATVDLVNAPEQEKAAKRLTSLPIGYCVSILSSSMSWDICRSAPQAVRCCSISSANSTSARASSSPPI
jgi:hypothetical protein